MLKLDNTIKSTRPIMYFNNDDDFYCFCVNPNIIISEYTRTDGTTGHVFDWDFTQTYKNAVENGTRFIIKDENSQICKHGAVSFHTCTKNVDNLEPYYSGPHHANKSIQKLSTYVNNEEAK